LTLRARRRFAALADASAVGASVLRIAAVGRIVDTFASPRTGSRCEATTRHARHIVDTLRDRWTRCTDALHLDHFAVLSAHAGEVANAGGAGIFFGSTARPRCALTGATPRGSSAAAARLTRGACARAAWLHTGACSGAAGGT
jgi:hypothetical protein